MRAMSHLAISLVAVVLWIVPASAGVKVTFTDPRRYAGGDLRYANVQKDLRAYLLTKNRKTIASGEELVADHFYRTRIGLASPSDPLRYEKDMLRDWFQTRFASHLRTGG